jgi:hypothetical protein
MHSLETHPHPRRQDPINDPVDIEPALVEPMLCWLQQVAEDRTLPPIAMRLAISLCRCFTIETGGEAAQEAYMAEQAAAVGIKRVDKVFQALIAGGHIASIRRGDDAYHFFALKPVSRTEGGRS